MDNFIKTRNLTNTSVMTATNQPILVDTQAWRERERERERLSGEEEIRWIINFSALSVINF